jgi:hypothetical protein
MPIYTLKVLSEVDGRLQVIAGWADQTIFGPTAAISRILQMTPSTKWPPEWDNTFGPETASFTAATNQDGRLELVALFLETAYDYWEKTPNGNDWSGGLASLGGTNLQQLVLAKNADGRLELFALGGDRAVYHRWQNAPGGSWSSWAYLGGIDLQQISVGTNQDGRLELFAIGGDRAIYHRWQVTPNGYWGDWAFLGGIDIQHIDIANNADGRMELFALGGDRAIYHRWQVVPNGDWGDWAYLGGVDLQQIVVGSNADGRLEVFALGGDAAAYHMWQVVPNGDWGGWAYLGGIGLQLLTVISDVTGRLQLFAVGGDNAVYRRWQIVQNGNWSDWDFVAPYPFHPPKALPPDSPTSVNAFAGDSTATVAWAAPAFDGGSAVTTYLLECYLSTSNAWQSETKVAGSASQGDVNGLKNGRTYYFKVIAQNSVGNSSPSAASNSVTPQMPMKQGIGSVAFYNCNDSKRSMTIWVNDLTAGTGWQEDATMPSQWDNGTCPAQGETPTEVTLATGHQYLIAAVDPDDPSCGGQDDPTIVNCARWQGLFLGLAGGQTFQVILS